MNDIKVAVLAPSRWFLTSFDEKDRETLLELGWSGKTVGDEASTENVTALIEGCNIAITSWDSLPFTADILSHAPDLGLICHAAGTVKSIVCSEVWKKNITVTSAASAIATGVGEHSLGLMLSAMKNCYALNDCMKQNIDPTQAKERIVETYDITVGVVGCGLTGKHFIRLLKMFDLNIIAYDPYLTPDEAANLGVEKVELNELMSRSDVISLHAPRLDETKHMINGDNLKLLKDHAILVNTASGWLIDEVALVKELKKRSIIAALDVTFPEPPAHDSELRKLPNVILTPHISGVASNNRFRIGHLVIKEIKLFLEGKPQLHPVTEESLVRIA